MKKVTKELLIYYLIEQELTPIETSVKLNVAKQSVYRAIKRYKVSFKSKKDKLKERDKKVCELFLNSELSLQELAIQYNCTKSNICLILQKNNLSVPTDRKNRNRAKTVMDRYGVDNVMHVDAIVKSREEYFIRKYGTKTPLGNKEVQKKAKATLFNKYSVDNPLKSRDIQQKVETTNIARYGGKAPACSTAVLTKMKKTNLKKYGVGNFSRKHLLEEVIELIQNKEEYKKKLTEWHHEQQLTSEEIANKLGMDKSAICKNMKELGIERKHFRRSKFEKDVESYIRSIYRSEVFINDRRYKSELDIYLPDIKLAIECDGLYWHSFNRIPTAKEKNYHKRKTELCLDNNIRLFHILESEWRGCIKQKVWKSILSNNLQTGINKRVFARKCKCDSIKDTPLVREFYTNNHLQGFVGSSVHVGLFLEKQLVACMSFSKQPGTEGEWTLTRFASLTYHSIIGGASKLFTFFCRNYNPTAVTTFADLRYSYGNIYKILGFELVGKVKPRYCYTDNKILLHRRNFQKKRLQKMLGSNYEPNLSEFQNVFSNTRYRVIYDAGKLKYLYKNTLK